MRFWNYFFPWCSLRDRWDGEWNLISIVAHLSLFLWNALAPPHPFLPALPFLLVLARLGAAPVTLTFLQFNAGTVSHFSPPILKTHFSSFYDLCICPVVWVSKAAGCEGVADFKQGSHHSSERLWQFERDPWDQACWLWLPCRRGQSLVSHLRVQLLLHKPPRVFCPQFT